ncbi:DUF4178 domain-containing protein [bacterium]|nr:DUF4178 domain-containing protein [bacterium]
MAIRDLFKKKEDDFDPLKDLELSKLQIGYYVDFDLKTWQVTDRYKVDYGEGYVSDEWELTAGREKWYLERLEDDEVEWSFSKKLPMGAIEGDIRQHIIDNEDPPNEIVCQGKTYYLDESGTGQIHKANEAAKEFIYWDFIDDEDEHFVTIEQWDETEFEASEGYYVEEYQFTSILPGGDAA